MSRHFLRVHPNDERPKDVIEHMDLDHVYAILIDYPSIRRSSRSAFDLPKWIETFNELAEERVGVEHFAPSVVIICSELEDEELEELDDTGAVVVDRSQLPDGLESLQALFRNLIPEFGTRQHLRSEHDVEPDVELNEDTIKFLEGDSEGITDEDRRELLDILGSE